jgi:hypothetical protein
MRLLHALYAECNQTIWVQLTNDWIPCDIFLFLFVCSKKEAPKSHKRLWTLLVTQEC